MNDYLFLQPLLVERIKNHVAGLGHVSALYDLAQLSTQSTAYPAVFVIYAGDNVSDGAPAKSMVTQRWITLLADNYPKQGKTGALLGSLINALSGWQPTGNGDLVMRRASEAMEVHFESSFLYFPLAFEARFIWPRMEKTTW